MTSATSVDERTITLDDFLQLQALLNYEQEKRDKHIEQCDTYGQGEKQQVEKPPQTTVFHAHPVHQHTLRPIQFRRAIDPQAALQSRLEKARLVEALMKLKWLKDQYKRQRMMEIELYLEHYRRQALVRAVLQEEEERYYRQCIAAALEQRRVQLCLQQYLDMKRQQELQSQFETQQFLADQQQQQQQQREKEEEEGDGGYSEYHSKQLEALLKHIFNQQIQEQNEIACKKQAESEEEQALAMAEIWKSLSDQKLNDETPRSAFLSEDHDALLKDDGSKEPMVDKTIPSTIQVPQNNNKVDEVEKEEQKSPAVEEKEKQIQFPPVQDHVVSLQDLIQQLASEPVLVDEQRIQYSDEPKPSGIWAKNEQQQQQQQPHNKSNHHHHHNKHHNNQPIPPSVSTKKKEEEEKNRKPFLPQHIFTEAEPTPTQENMPNTPLGAQEQGEDEHQDFKHFVDSVAAEQKNETVPADPRKLKTYEELDAISKQLTDNDLVKRWKHVMQCGKDLTFSKQQEGTLILTASNDFNREFLDSEDELMKVMLKLDTVNRLGDDSIREERKKLVKKCESMLDDLDQFKQCQWEKAVTE